MRRYRPLKTRLARELRKDMTHTEVRLWLHLKSRQVDGWKFRRQTPIGEYIVDFYCPAARLVVELDGASHDSDEQDDRDLRRQRWLESHGYRVLRFSADNPEGDYPLGVWETIQVALEEIALQGIALQGIASVPPPALRATSPRSGEDVIVPPPALRATSPRSGEDVIVPRPATRATSPRSGEDVMA